MLIFSKEGFNTDPPNFQQAANLHQCGIYWLLELGNTGTQLMSGDPGQETLRALFHSPVLMTYLALNLRVPIVLPGLWLHLWIHLLFVAFLQNSGFLEPPHSYFLSIETTAKRLFLSQHQHLIPGKTLNGSVLVTCPTHGHRSGYYTIRDALEMLHQSYMDSREISQAKGDRQQKGIPKCFEQVLKKNS